MPPKISVTIRIFVDAIRVSTAFRAVARGGIEKAMQKLSSVGDFASKTFEVRLLKEALHSHMANHQVVRG